MVGLVHQTNAHTTMSFFVVVVLFSDRQITKHMVLTSGELANASAFAGLPPSSESIKISSLLHLRKSTDNFVIQALADRQIQRSLHDSSGKNKPSEAYLFNCNVVETPHAYSHFRAVSGAGWTSSNRPPDLQLRIISNNPSVTEHIHEKDVQLRRLKEALKLSEENNAQTKRLYTELVKQRQHRSPASVGSPQHEIGVLRAQLEAKTKTIRRYDGDIIRLQAQIDSLEDELLTERQNNRSNTSSSSSSTKKLNKPTVRFDDTPTISLLPPSSSPKISIVSRNQSNSYAKRTFCGCIVM